MAAAAAPLPAVSPGEVDAAGVVRQFDEAPQVGLQLRQLPN